MATKPKPERRESMNEEFLKPREAALELRITFPTIKQWIYKRKIRSIPTAGGHHRIPQSEVDRLLFRTIDCFSEQELGLHASELSQCVV
jgi:excisionase family DNA binding protein